MNPVAVFDFTASCDKNPFEKVTEWLKENAKKWTFQKEQGCGLKKKLEELSDDSDSEESSSDSDVSESSSEMSIVTGTTSAGSSVKAQGFLHYQGRFSLSSKTRTKTLIKFLTKSGLKFHLTPTMKKNLDKWDYVTKKETRVEGPWSSEDKPIVIPRQLQKVYDAGWYPYQKKILELMDVEDDDHIDVLVAKEGMEGKTTIATHLGVHGKGLRLPMINNYKDIAQWVMSFDTRKIYMLDIPRAIGKKDNDEMMAAIEMLKGGYVFDTRYKGVERYFDAPNIWIFTNDMPGEKLLSKKRWRVWTVKDNELIKV